jgi:hypothetical protein
MRELRFLRAQPRSRAFYLGLGGKADDFLLNRGNSWISGA